MRNANAAFLNILTNLFITSIIIRSFSDRNMQYEHKETVLDLASRSHSLLHPLSD